ASPTAAKAGSHVPCTALIGAAHHPPPLPCAWRPRAGCSPGDHSRPSRVGRARKHQKGATMAKDHGSSVKNDKQYEGLRKKGMSKSRAASIANAPGASSRGGKSSGGGKKRQNSSQGGSRAQKQAAG